MAFKRTMTLESEKKIVADYEDSGDSIAKLAKRYNMSHSGMEKLLHRNNAKVREQGAHLNRRIIQPEQEAEVIRLYRDEHISVTDLAKRYKCSEPSIRQAINRNDIEKRRGRTFVGDEIDRVVELYQGGMTITEISRKFNLKSQMGVYNALRAAKVEIKTPVKPWRIHPLLETAFDNIDNEQAAYFLGFIYADGCVYKQNLQIGIKEEDKEVLVNLLAFLQTDYPIRTYIRKTGFASTPVSTILVANKYMARRLNDLGIVKDRIMGANALSISIPQHLYRHFIRGLCDGDGCIRIDRINFAVDKKCTDWMNEIFHNFLETKRAAVKVNHNVCAIDWWGEDAYKIAKWLYDDSSVFLTRKYNKARKLIERGDKKYRTVLLPS